VAEVTVAEVMAEPAALEDPRAREVNERHGDDHGVNLGKLRALAKRLRTQQELAPPARRGAAPGLVRRSGSGGGERRPVSEGWAPARAAPGATQAADARRSCQRNPPST
jgi:hypothetical protein